MTTRRNFLIGALAASMVPQLSWADAGSPAYLGAAKDESGQFALYGLSATSDIVFRVDLPGRGHAAAAHPTRPEAVAFARRPGTYALVVDCANGQVKHSLQAPKGRHFMGHGVFMRGGDILVTTENNYADRKGCLGLWQRSKDYARIGEVDSHGIGPHDIRMLSDGTFVIANGGIFTHPDQGEGRDKLNLDTMRPSLAYLTADFTLSEQHFLFDDLHHASIRHLAVHDDGLVGFAMQWQGDPFDSVPLIGLHRRGDAAPLLMEAPLGQQMSMHAYASSIAFNGAGTELAITSSKGGRLHRFALDGQFVGAAARTDLSGLAPYETGYLGSDGFGALLAFDPDARVLNSVAGLSWDNHLVSLPRLG
ncbi:DUF1513 domain-containing protein [Pacificibacter marinus]|uniref:DUF1513 domain-containing protein n=1 Tax=Pacificibacter marinus TaxID=658057 RepID=A0A1Y5TBU4_9RHOB|nr:DUF1513 domain-containing protein [Pacificibacter marinus]SEL22394.1 hypothetical protein SAMN04488032_11482 [Pacificibacter marinus]SLN56882.1 hypothetical protein PAM7971_02944 [Pacificibacter marinus]